MNTRSGTTLKTSMGLASAEKKTSLPPVSVMNDSPSLAPALNSASRESLAMRYPAPREKAPVGWGLLGTPVAQIPTPPERLTCKGGRSRPDGDVGVWGCSGPKAPAPWSDVDPDCPKAVGSMVAAGVIA